MSEKTRTIEDSKLPVAISASKAEYHLKTFDRLLLDVFDETLKRLFNDSAVNAIYFFLENICHLPLGRIPAEAELFSTSLQKLLGSGASIIEQGILKTLYSRLELNLAQEEGYRFSDYIDELREKYQENGN